MSDSNQVSFAILEEVSWGVTPASALQELPFSSESLVDNPTTQPSTTIRADRQVPDNIRLNVSPGGDLNYNLQYAAYDELFEGFMMDAFGAELAIGPEVTISTTTPDTIDDSGSGFGAIVAGQWIKTSGFAAGNNNGFFKVLTATAASLTLQTAAITTEAAGASVSIAGSLLTNGTTFKSYSIEKEYLDLTTTFDSFLGTVIGSMSLSIPAAGPVTGTFGTLAKAAAVTQTASIGTGANVAALTNQEMQSVDHVAFIREGGALSTFDTLAVTINGANNLRQQPAVGVLGASGIGLGVTNISGTLDVYFEDRTLLDKARAYTDTSLAVQVQDAAGNSYIFDMEGVNISAGDPTVTGQDADVVSRFTFLAKLGGTSGKTVGINKFAA